ncbi:hypothetical protein R3P38DRAFT_3219299 [Favolaschia claudopus]|uniref:F-box domain-containing protein n=1 Tax=Favolaschia claudopus TaxID=2862362 RepID=A0AAW0A2L6_9AGAR
MSWHNKALHRLNLCTDPMARLPLEIQSLIFLHVPISTPFFVRYRHPTRGWMPRPTPDARPMVFLGVCRLWRDIALSTPKLWSEIELELPRGPEYISLCKLWLTRARSLPLSLSLHGSLDLDESVQDLVDQYSHQLERLTLSPLWTETPGPGIPFTTEDMLLPSLEILTFQATDGFKFDRMTQWLGILSVAPMLSRLYLVDVHFESEGDEELPSGPLTMACLSILFLGAPFFWDLTGDQGSTCRILRYLTLPTLKHLSISSSDLSYKEFVAFLSRSSPSLELLRLDLTSDWSLPMLSQSLRLMPTLADLTLSGVRDDCLIDAHEVLPLFDTNLSTTPDFLPNLHAIRMSMLVQRPIDYEMVLRVLTSRRVSCPIRLKSFTFKVSTSTSGLQIPGIMPDHVKTALQQLITDGLKVRIGNVYPFTVSRR